MSIVKCPSCRRRFDPGIDVDPDDMPEGHDMLVVCPACEQWISLPDREPVETPDLPKKVRREMMQQATLVDDDEERDRPKKRRRDTDDDDGDSRPKKSKSPAKSGKSGNKTTLYIILGVVAVLGLLGCCGGGGLLFYLYGSNKVTIDQAVRPSPSMVSVNFRVDTAPKAGHEFFIIVSGGGQTFVSPRGMASRATERGTAGFTFPGLGPVRGPLQVWMEERAAGAASGSRISNKVLIP